MSVNAAVPGITRSAPACSASRTALAQAAAVLDAQPGLSQGLQNSQVGRGRAAESPIQVDDVQPAGAGRTPALGHGQRIGPVDGLAIRVALGQPHHPPLAQIKRREEREGRGSRLSSAVHRRHPRSTKFLSSSNPTCWLFSG